MPRENLITKLFDIGAVKFGSFTLKSGIVSPIYIDLRLIVSYPQLLKEVADAMWEKTKRLQVDCICGVPYTALPIATAISLAQGIPMVMRRKEGKEYGTRRVIEGVYNYGQQCMVIEDLVTSGASVFETIDPLEHEGLKVKDVVVLIDREQGGKQRLEDCGYHLHAVLILTSMLQHLEAGKKISSETVSEVLEYINPRV
ncbi:MAG: orotate phosphoribosyltransferase [Waddliaceae bacterium]